ncbi:MAG: hypothetical protein ACRC20_02095 [Segniliparus sp.]|uniref:hypothetical protein n=1 Tax=Segniliparus sp. TaxID=2804064 RepID=UPI003F2B26C9
MDPVEQLYHLQLESRKQTQQLQRETTSGFEYLRKSAEASSRRVQQSLGQGSPQSARSSDRGWASSTRNIGGPAAPQEIKSPEEAVPPGLPADLRNILIRNQQMEQRWRREFAERLRQAGEERPGAFPGRAEDPRRQAEQQRGLPQPRQAAPTRTPAPQQGARVKGRGWGDSTRRIGPPHGDD